MEEHWSTCAAVRRGAILIAVVVGALAAAPIAGAHAVLVSTTPSNDQVVERAPRAIVLRFNEAVESAFGSVRVYDSQARRVDDGRIERPDERTVGVGIDRRLAGGTYTVTWRVVSADSHPVSGAFVFHVGRPGANPGGVGAQVLGAGTPRTVTVLSKIVRFLVFALLILVVGGAVALAYPLRTAAETLRARLFALLAVWALLLGVAALASIVVQAAAAGGVGLADAVHWNSVQAVLETRFGKVAVGQAALAVAVAVLTLGAPRAVPFAAIALVPTPGLAGHASVRGGLALVADVVHVASAAIWTGGLAFVVLALLGAGAERWPLAARAVPRFSKVAVVSVAALIVSGSVNGYEEVGAWRGLWDTTYGLLLLAKVAFVLPLLALGAYNNRYAVPRLAREIASTAEQRRFLQAAGAELALVVAIVGITAVLVTEPPARATVAPRGPYATTVALDGIEANVVTDPAKPGLNAIHLYLTDRSGRPVDVDELRLSASLPSEKIGPLRFPAHPLAAGHYAVHGAQLALAGDWQLRIDARRGEFEALSATLSIPIRTDS
jgi:copper transport protein